MSIRIMRQHQLQREGVRGDRSRRYQRISRGLYSDGESVDPDERWRAALNARLHQSGPDAIVAIRSAARLHQLDGFRESQAIDTLTTRQHHARTPGVHRTATLHDDDIVAVDGYPTTSIGRTLFDLGRVVDDDAVEMALESALRGPNPGTPLHWNSELLEELERRVVRVRAKTGAATLRRALLRRPPAALPTGSYAETSFLQALREVGLGAARRQLEIRHITPSGEVARHFYPDFCFDERLTIVEVNGALARGGSTMTAADVSRQNQLAKVFRIHVVSGSDAVDPWKRRVAAAEVRSVLRTQSQFTFPARVHGIIVTRTPTGFDLLTGQP